MLSVNSLCFSVGPLVVYSDEEGKFIPKDEVIRIGKTQYSNLAHLFFSLISVIFFCLFDKESLYLKTGKNIIEQASLSGMNITFNEDDGNFTIQIKARDRVEFLQPQQPQNANLQTEEPQSFEEQNKKNYERIKKEKEPTDQVKKALYTKALSLPGSNNNFNFQLKPDLFIKQCEDELNTIVRHVDRIAANHQKNLAYWEGHFCKIELIPFNLTEKDKLAIKSKLNFFQTPEEFKAQLLDFSKKYKLNQMITAYYLPLAGKFSININAYEDATQGFIEKAIEKELFNLEKIASDCVVEMLLDGFSKKFGSFIEEADFENKKAILREKLCDVILGKADMSEFVATFKSQINQSIIDTLVKERLYDIDFFRTLDEKSDLLKGMTFICDLDWFAPVSAARRNPLLYQEASKNLS